MPLLEDHSGLGGIPAYQALPGLYGVDAYREAYRREIRYLDAQIALEELESRTSAERLRDGCAKLFSPYL